MYAYVSASYDDCFVKIWATCENFLGKWFTAPPGKKLPVRLCLEAFNEWLREVSNRCHVSLDWICKLTELQPISAWLRLTYQLK